MNRQTNLLESITIGFVAWLFLFSIVMWFGGIVVTFLDLISTHETNDIWILLFASFLTGYALDFIIRSRPEISVADTMDFLKEAIQFRRSAQHRLTILELMQQRKKQQDQRTTEIDPHEEQRAKLHTSLNKGRELENQLTLLREGKTVDLGDLWRTNTKMHSAHPLFQQVIEFRVEPSRKRFVLVADFPDLDEIQLKDEMAILRLNRQIYDFLQSMLTEAWLKPYTAFIESYYLLCRATKVTAEGIKFFYPFMKVGIMISELRKLEGSYFNPRKLSEIAALAFNDGAPV